MTGVDSRAESRAAAAIVPSNLAAARPSARRMPVSRRSLKVARRERDRGRAV
jgi:hypothetical protein